MKVGDWVRFEWGGDELLGVIKRIGGGSLAIDCNGVEYCVMADDRVSLANVWENEHGEAAVIDEEPVTGEDGFDA